MRRVAIAFFYDADGIVDDYMTYFIKSLKPFVERTVFVSNGKLQPQSLKKVKKIVPEIIERENEGLDVGGYKAGLDYIGFDELKKYDEVILYNHTIFGPFYPFSEMFNEMEKRDVDFWGITAHKAVANAFFGGAVPYHIQSHFIAIRNTIISKPIFEEYWRNLPPINSYADSVQYHEGRFTKYFEDLGFTHSVYMDDNNLQSLYPILEQVDKCIEERCPIIKRRSFFHDPLRVDWMAMNFPRALRIIKKTSDYDMGLAWKNIVRTVKPRELTANSARLSILSDKPNKSTNHKIKLKIGVFIHLYYIDELDFIKKYISNINCDFDLFISTSDKKNAKIIKKYFDKNICFKKLTIRVVEQNRGRDMSSLFITFRDILLSDKYDVACRLHSKKTPQCSASQSAYFIEHLFDNLLASKSYVDNLLNLFKKDPNLGLVMPPIIHIGFGTLGFSWYSNKPKVEEVCKKLDIKVPLDDNTPVAPYGTMFWFRPKALRKLFEYKWKWEDFNAEPNHVDGGLAHALERTIAYAAHDAGYYSQHVLSTTEAPYNYVMLEYKLQKLMAYLPSARLSDDIGILNMQRSSEAAAQYNQTLASIHIGSRKAYKNLKVALKIYRTEAIRSFIKSIKRLFRRKNALNKAK